MVEYNMFDDLEEALDKDIEEATKRDTVFKKVKGFIENPDVISTIAGGLIGGGCALVGYIVGCKSTVHAISKGIDVMNNVGFIRYFDRACKNQ